MSLNINSDESIRVLEQYNPEKGDRLYVEKTGDQYSLAVASGFFQKAQHIFSFSDELIAEIKKQLVLKAFLGRPDNRTAQRTQKIFDLILKGALPQLDLEEEGQVVALLPSNIKKTKEWIQKGAMRVPQIKLEEWRKVVREKIAGEAEKFDRHERRQQEIIERRRDLHVERSAIEDGIVRKKAKDFRDEITKGLGGFDYLDEKLGHEEHTEAQGKLYGLCEEILFAKSDLEKQGKQPNEKERNELEVLEKQLIDHMQKMKGDAAWGRLAFISIGKSKQLYHSLMQSLEKPESKTTPARILEILEEEMPLATEQLSHEVLKAAHHRRFDELSLLPNQQKIAGYILFSRVQEGLWETIDKTWESLTTSQKRDEQLEAACLKYCTAADTNQRNESRWDIVEIVRRADGDIDELVKLLDSFDTISTAAEVPNPPPSDMRLFKEIQQKMHVEPSEQKAEREEADIERRTRNEFLRNLCVSYLGTKDPEEKEALKQSIVNQTLRVAGWENVFSGTDKEIAQKMTEQLTKGLQAQTEEEAHQQSQREKILSGLCNKYCDAPTQNVREGIREAIIMGVGEEEAAWLIDLLDIADAVYPAGKPRPKPSEAEE